MVEGVITSYDPLPKEGIILADEATFTFGKRDYVSKDKRLNGQFSWLLFSVEALGSTKCI